MKLAELDNMVAGLRARSRGKVSIGLNEKEIEALAKEAKEFQKLLDVDGSNLFYSGVTIYLAKQAKATKQPKEKETKEDGTNNGEDDTTGTTDTTSSTDNPDDQGLDSTQQENEQTGSGEGEALPDTSGDGEIRSGDSQEPSTEPETKSKAKSQAKSKGKGKKGAKKGGKGKK